MCDATVNRGNIYYIITHHKNTILLLFVAQRISEFRFWGVVVFIYVQHNVEANMNDFHN